MICVNAKRRKRPTGHAGVTRTSGGVKGVTRTSGGVKEKGPR